MFYISESLQSQADTPQSPATLAKLDSRESSSSSLTRSDPASGVSSAHTRSLESLFEKDLLPQPVRRSTSLLSEMLRSSTVHTEEDLTMAAATSTSSMQAAAARDRRKKRLQHNHQHQPQPQPQPQQPHLPQTHQRPTDGAAYANAQNHHHHHHYPQHQNPTSTTTTHNHPSHRQQPSQYAGNAQGAGAVVPGAATSSRHCQPQQVQPQPQHQQQQQPYLYQQAQQKPDTVFEGTESVRRTLISDWEPMLKNLHSQQVPSKAVSDSAFQFSFRSACTGW